MAEERIKRKLAAIVSADVVGWSRLMGEDEAGTLATLKRHREELIDPKIAEYGGRIVSTAGDGVLVEYSGAVDVARFGALSQAQQPGRASRTQPGRSTTGLDGLGKVSFRSENRALENCTSGLAGLMRCIWPMNPSFT